MTRLFSKTNLKAFSSVLAFVLLLGTIPLTTGVVIDSAPSYPEFTVNICTPTQMLSYKLSSTLARPSLDVAQFLLFFRGSLKATPTVEVVKYGEPPDTPPPKLLV
ncbi:MAG: hypothetical protein JO138_04020, partial [Acidobacteriaceae bacterium]|nr:hypothetical protein [Acidobacteriaceae bacterium]